MIVRSRLAAAVLAAAATLLAGPAAAQDQQPRLYQGRPAAYWVDALEKPEALSALAEALADPDERVRFVVAKALAAVAAGNTGSPDPEGALPLLIEALADASDGVRRVAIMGLIEAGPQARAAVPVLAALLARDESERVRLDAAEALSRVGRDVPEALEALRKAQAEDPSQSVRRAAGDAVERLQASPGSSGP
jgi:HEAT repeat protein